MPTDEIGNSPTYLLSVVGEGLSMEREINEAVLLQILSLVIAPRSQLPAGVIGASANLAASSAIVSGRGEVTGPRLSIREYLDDIGARKNPEKIVAIGNYLTNVLSNGQKQTFGKSELRPQFRNASEPIPANISRDIREAMASGWIAEDHGNTDEFFVTRKGLEAIESSFSKDRSGGPRLKRRIVIRPRSNNTPADENESTNDNEE